MEDTGKSVEGKFKTFTKTNVQHRNMSSLELQSTKLKMNRDNSKTSNICVDKQRDDNSSNASSSGKYTNDKNLNEVQSKATYKEIDKVGKQADENTTTSSQCDSTNPKQKHVPTHNLTKNEDLCVISKSDLLAADEEFTKIYNQYMGESDEVSTESKCTSVQTDTQTPKYRNREDITDIPKNNVSTLTNKFEKLFATNQSTICKPNKSFLEKKKSLTKCKNKSISLSSESSHSKNSSSLDEKEDDLQLTSSSDTDYELADFSDERKIFAQTGLYDSDDDSSDTSTDDKLLDALENKNIQNIFNTTNDDNKIVSKPQNCINYTNISNLIGLPCAINESKSKKDREKISNQVTNKNATNKNEADFMENKLNSPKKVTKTKSTVPHSCITYVSTDSETDNVKEILRDGTANEKSIIDADPVVKIVSKPKQKSSKKESTIEPDSNFRNEAKVIVKEKLNNKDKSWDDINVMLTPESNLIIKTMPKQQKTNTNSAMMHTKTNELDSVSESVAGITTNEKKRTTTCTNKISAHADIVNNTKQVKAKNNSVGYNVHCQVYTKTEPGSDNKDTGLEEIHKITKNLASRIEQQNKLHKVTESTLNKTEVNNPNAAGTKRSSSIKNDALTNKITNLIRETQFDTTPKKLTNTMPRIKSHYSKNSSEIHKEQLKLKTNTTTSPNPTQIITEELLIQPTISKTSINNNFNQNADNNGIFSVQEVKFEKELSKDRQTLDTSLLTMKKKTPQKQQTPKPTTNKKIVSHNILDCTHRPQRTVDNNTRLTTKTKNNRRI